MHMKCTVIILKVKVLNHATHAQQMYIVGISANCKFIYQTTDALVFKAYRVMNLLMLFS